MVSSVHGGVYMCVYVCMPSQSIRPLLLCSGLNVYTRGVYTSPRYLCPTTPLVYPRVRVPHARFAFGHIPRRVPAALGFRLMHDHLRAGYLISGAPLRGQILRKQRRREGGRGTFSIKRDLHRYATIANASPSNNNAVDSFKTSKRLM